MNINSTADLVRSCTGCGMCAAICPAKAISVKLNDNGFYLPAVDSEKCVRCKKCKTVCYKYDKSYTPYAENDDTTRPVCYSAKNLDKNELLNSSSGAVSIELMRYCITAGYKVVGVAYDSEKNVAVTKIASAEHELEGFRGSKYFQSFTQSAFEEIVRDNSEQKYAVFGTPCQIYALSMYTSRAGKRDSFLFVDIFCHGCPSMNVWSKYLESVKTNTGVSEFDSITFRSKVHGWHEYSFEFEKDKQKYPSSKHSDPFYELFFSMNAMNEACYDCVARSSFEKTDIRIGDFWGKRYDTDTEGVSAVVIQTPLGKEVFSAVKHKFECHEADLDEMISAQSFGKIHRLNDAKRSKTLDMLKSDMPIKSIIKQHRKLLPIKLRFRNSVKRGLKYLPASLYLSLKSVVHKGDL